MLTFHLWTRATICVAHRQSATTESPRHNDEVENTGGDEQVDQYVHKHHGRPIVTSWGQRPFPPVPIGARWPLNLLFSPQFSTVNCSLRQESPVKVLNGRSPAGLAVASTLNKKNKPRTALRLRVQAMVTYLKESLQSDGPVSFWSYLIEQVC